MVLTQSTPLMSGNLFQTAAAALHADEESVPNCPGKEWVQAAMNRTPHSLANETVVHTYTKHTNQSAVTRTDTLAERCGSCT